MLKYRSNQQNEKLISLSNDSIDNNSHSHNRINQSDSLHYVNSSCSNKKLLATRSSTPSSPSCTISKISTITTTTSTSSTSNFIIINNNNNNVSSISSALSSSTSNSTSINRNKQLTSPHRASSSTILSNYYLRQQQISRPNLLPIPSILSSTNISSAIIQTKQPSPSSFSSNESPSNILATGSFIVNSFLEKFGVAGGSTLTSNTMSLNSSRSSDQPQSQQQQQQQQQQQSSNISWRDAPSSLNAMMTNTNISNNNNQLLVTPAVGGGNMAPTNDLAFYDFSDQELMASDNKYRQYALAIDKALKSFEYTSEWADLVNALGKLNRVLTNNSRFCKIPRRFIVGQRLAQCMHPLLPSGVHLKALETYHLIFNCLGEEQLLADLTIYSNGLFPLLGYAAINVRPSVLDLYERHILPLGEQLHLALDGFLISLLPCYEEGSESFQRTDALLLKVASGVGVAHFYGALWRCILQNSSIRLPAITFVLMHFNKKRSLSEQAQVLGLCMRTLVRAICSALLDQHILVQRAILDLLITIFPIHLNLMNEMEQAMSSPQNNGSTTSTSASATTNTSQILLSPNKPSMSGNHQSSNNQIMSRKYFKRSELIAIITSALTVLLRRDLSLNRRLCSWFFGSDMSSSTSSSGSSSSNTNHSASSNHLNTSTNISGSSGSSSGFSSKSSQSTFTNNSGSVSASSTTTTTSSKESSSEAKARKKKLFYFETYTRDLVIEAFKRCITNPLTAITSILPPTALTNSFISFTLPYMTTSLYGTQAASASSSPSSSTSSLLHLHSHSYTPYRNNSLHGNTHSRPISYLSMGNTSSVHCDSLYTSMSIFWPYRLLNCIMDQRDIAGPILDTLCVDILRGLYHEFELLTTMVPPPTAIEDSANQNNKEKSEFNYSTSNFNDSSTTLSSASLISSSNRKCSQTKKNSKNSKTKRKLKPKFLKLKSNKSKSTKMTSERRKTIYTSNSMKKVTQHKKPSNSNTTSDINNSYDIKSSKEESVSETDQDELKCAQIDKSNPVNDEDFDDELSDDEEQLDRRSKISQRQSQKQLKVQGLNRKFLSNKKTKTKLLKQNVTVYSDDETAVNKRNLNLFQNLRRNVRNKFNKIQFPLGNNNQKGNDLQSTNSDTIQSGSHKNMRTVVKTFMTRQLKLKIKPGVDENLQETFGRKKKETNQSSAAAHFNTDKSNLGSLRPCNTPTTDEMESRNSLDASSIAAGQSNQAGRPASDDNDDDSVFVLPHQHYYWNPYYQQLNKTQRKELLKELDRVMHLLFTNVGVDFIWTKLALTFQSAAEEAIALKKFLHILVKTATTRRLKRDSSANNAAKTVTETDEDEEDYQDEFILSDVSDSAGAPEVEDDERSQRIESESESEESEMETDTISQSLSLSWIRSLASSLISELIIENPSRANYSFESSSTSSSSRSSSDSSLSSSRICSLECYPNDEMLEECGSTKEFVSNTLKHKLLLSLADRCRQCGQALTYSSPVQPVGTDSLTILESCTLVRFLLGDSQPYRHNLNGDDNYQEGLLYYSPGDNTGTSSLLINSVSVSMNRCSALEPLAVDTVNYNLLIQFLDHVLRLMCQSAKSFTPIDLRASIELCLALCSKLKPAIMQTFVLRYRYQVAEMKNKEFDQSLGQKPGEHTQHSRKSSLTSWFNTYGQTQHNNPRNKTRSSSSFSSSSGKSTTKQLELVKEETEDDEVINNYDRNDQINSDMNEDENEKQDDQCEFNDDLQIELVVDGVLEFFSTFVETIMIKKQPSTTPTTSDYYKHEQMNKSGRMAILDYYRYTMFNPREQQQTTNVKSRHHNQSFHYGLNSSNRQQTTETKFASCTKLAEHQPPVFHHQLLPIYQLLCELLIEIGTMPLLSSPAFLLKKRDQKIFKDTDFNFSCDVRWFIYLMVLSGSNLSPCSLCHPQSAIQDGNSNNCLLTCCKLRHIAYTSLSTILDLMTMTRAYVVSQPHSLSVMTNCSDEFQIPSYVDMTSLDLFPSTFVARRLNFFPLVHPKMLQHVYESTSWFKIIASGLWSNLCGQDSALHHTTCALLQQLHSISHDESICEVVICDEMSGGNYCAVGLRTSLNHSTYNNYDQDQLNFRLLNMVEQQTRCHSHNNLDLIHKARFKFALMFSIIQDIRFISERLALIVTTLSSAAKSSDCDSESGANGIDYEMTINDSCSNNKLISQLEIDVATGTCTWDMINLTMATNYNDLPRLLRITCPVSPVALCSTLKRHFDRPLFIMLDALSQRRTLSEQYSISANWLLQCLKNPDVFGTKNLMFTSPNGFGVTCDFQTGNSDGSNHNIGSNNNQADIGRLLEPLLFILLHPDTARLSIKNVDILRFTKPSPTKDQMTNQISYPNRSPSLNFDQQKSIDMDQSMIDESKIYAISSTNGNVIYHVQRRPPSKSCSNPNSMDPQVSPNIEHETIKLDNRQRTHKFPLMANASFTAENLFHISGSVLQSPKSTDSIKIISNPLERYFVDQKTDLPYTNNQIETEIKQIVEDLVEQVIVGFDHDVDLDHFMINSTNEEHYYTAQTNIPFIEPIKSFPGMASFTKVESSPTASTSTPTEDRFDQNARQKLHFSQMHLHLLLYERRYDSLRTTYALDTILTMIETWPSRVLYSMSTTTLFSTTTINSSSYNQVNGSQACSSSTSIFDGTRSAQIKILYQRHQNSIQGNGFYSINQKANQNQMNQTSNTNHLRSKSLTKLELLTSTNDNITLLELIIQICLQYLRSYYPSCPADMTTTQTANKLKKSNINALDELFFQIRSNYCIDLEAIYGNQRVRLLACQALRVIFYHLSQMIEVQNHNRDSSRHGHHYSSSHKRQPNESLLFFSQSKSFAQFLKEIMTRCEVQRNVLQCLVTSVWHYQYKSTMCSSKMSSDYSNTDGETKQKQQKVKIDSYLFPDTSYHSKVNPADNAFIKEILDYNDYPENSNRESPCSFSNKSDHYHQGFQDELEKSLLNLLEQVMILEFRIQSVLMEATSKPSEFVSSHSIVSRTSVKDLSEMSFDPSLPLAGQPLLNGALHYAFQQNFRRHIHSEWLSFVESALHYAGRFMSRLVLTVVHQFCRNLDSCSKEIDQFASSVCISSFHSNIPPSTYKHFFHTLQGIAMIYSYCLLERNQFELLASVLNEILDDNENSFAKTFGLVSVRRRHRFDADSLYGSDHWSLNNGSAASVSSNGSTGAIQTIASIFHNIMIMSGSNSSGTTDTPSHQNASSQSDSSPLIDSVVSSQQDTLFNNLSLTRQRILDYTNLNRVLTSLFNVWCTILVLNDSSDTCEDTNSSHQASSYCHPYSKQLHNRSLIHKNSQFNCSLGWSSVSTGWYISGSSIVIRRSILTILSIVAVSNGVSLMKSIARVWHDLRDRDTATSASNPDSLMADSIDVVIMPTTANQEKLVQLIASLVPVLNLEYLIQIVRAILKPSSTASSQTSTSASASSITTEVESTQHLFTCNPFDNIFLIEVSLLEFFLAYIRTCSGDLLLKSWRSMLALIKDCFSLNLFASVPYETFWPRNRNSSMYGPYRQQQPIPSSSVQINFQPLINIHLLAIMHEFVITAPFVEDRRAQKELQDVAQRLIDANINVAGGRLLPSRFWSFRRNFEVMPFNSDIVGSGLHGRPSPTSQRSPSTTSSDVASILITEEALSNSQNEHIPVKRGLFRTSASVQFQEKSHSSARSTPTPTPTDGSDWASDHQNESLLFGLFNFNFSNSSSGSNSGSASNHHDLATTSQNLFYSFFCIKALYAMAEFAAPVLDVVYASEEKEKMIPLITNLMSYVIPYLKSHSQHNLPCFDACSRLLASLSGYQYTRKAWRRESLELLLDPAFFQMPPGCLPAWRTIIDHLMTHDKNTFREFLQRMSVTQSPSVSFKIFVPSTKDQESEPRAQLVKRLAFILFCSEKDQYQKYMAEIQEKLIEIHRTSQQTNSSQPSQIHAQSLLQSQVLLAFRVILLRMSPHYLASLWPFIYTEMFQVFLTIEQALLKVIRDEQKNLAANEFNPSNLDSYAYRLDLPDFLNSHRLSTGSLYSSPNFHHRTIKLDPKIPAAQLQLFLNACKLLDLALLLPSDILPQFQLHKWAFISDAASSIQSLDYFNLFGSNDVQQYNFTQRHSQTDLISNLSTGTTGQDNSTTNDQQPASLNLDLISTAHMENIKSYSETNSLNSSTTYDTSSTGAPQSLPANLNTSTTSSNQQQQQKDINVIRFVPHIVFINSLLNYITDSIPKQIGTTCGAKMYPLITTSSIESIHDLHPFFTSLLSRSNQGATFMPMTTDQQSQDYFEGHFCRQNTMNESYRRSMEYRTNSANSTSASNSQNNPNTNSLNNRRKSLTLSSNTTTSGSYQQQQLHHSSPNTRSNSKTSYHKDQPIGTGRKSSWRPSTSSNNNQSPSMMINNGGCSLDELFINIDRIIANDFLEPFPSSSD